MINILFILFLWFYFFLLLSSFFDNWAWNWYILYVQANFTSSIISFSFFIVFFGFIIFSTGFFLVNKSCFSLCGAFFSFLSLFFNYWTFILSLLSPCHIVSLFPFSLVTTIIYFLYLIRYFFLNFFFWLIFYWFSEFIDDYTLLKIDFFLTLEIKLFELF